MGSNDTVDGDIMKVVLNVEPGMGSYNTVHPDTTKVVPKAAKASKRSIGGSSCSSATMITRGHHCNQQANQMRAEGCPCVHASEKPRPGATVFSSS